ncbi:MAG: hypothetical protein K2L83_03550, partial [Muribaculaceae bacterium]|nr:hypothetical protein [Muribaculaceae bacterium]
MRADIQNGIIVNGDDTKKATTPRGVAAFFSPGCSGIRSRQLLCMLYRSRPSVSAKSHAVPAILSRIHSILVESALWREHFRMKMLFPNNTFGVKVLFGKSIFAKFAKKIEMENLIRISHRLVSQIDTTLHRYLYDQISWDAKLVMIKGARGVGKTTMLLQRIKEQFGLSEKALYVS